MWHKHPKYHREALVPCLSVQAFCYTIFVKCHVHKAVTSHKYKNTSTFSQCKLWQFLMDTCGKCSPLCLSLLNCLFSLLCNVKHSLLNVTTHFWPVQTKVLKCNEQQLLLSFGQKSNFAKEEPYRLLLILPGVWKCSSRCVSVWCNWSVSVTWAWRFKFQPQFPRSTNSNEFHDNTENDNTWMAEHTAKPLHKHDVVRLWNASVGHHAQVLLSQWSSFCWVSCHLLHQKASPQCHKALDWFCTCDMCCFWSMVDWRKK